MGSLDPDHRRCPNAVRSAIHDHCPGRSNRPRSRRTPDDGAHCWAGGLRLGIVWGAWHAPSFSRPDSFAGALPLLLLLAQLFAWLPAYRVLMVWVYERTNSLLVGILMHVSLTATAFILPPPASSDMQTLLSILASAGVWWLLVAAVQELQRLPRQGPGVPPVGLSNRKGASS